MRYKVGITSSKFGSISTRGSSARPIAKSSSDRKYKYRKIKKYSPTREKTGKWGWSAPKSMKKKEIMKKVGKILGVFIGIMTLGALAGTLYVGATLANIKRSLPDPNALVDRTSDQSTRIYDRGGPENGKLLYTIYGDENREFVSVDKIPNYTKWALLAAEDVEFYDHKGIDIPGLAMAVYVNVIKGEEGRGSSTISQQLVRNTLLYDYMGDDAYERSYMRKLKEILITMQLEQTLSKDEILQMYMNEIPLGGTNYGYEAAAKSYFDKDVSELTLAESAMLAGLIQAPGAYSPLFGSEPEKAIERQNYVLDQMWDNRDYIREESKKHGEELVITEDMIKQAKSEVLQYADVQIDIEAPHFVFYVKDQLIQEYGIDRVERGGLTVTTSLDYETQQIAEEEVRAGVDKFRTAYNVNNGSMVAIDPKTGEVLAMVGSYDYWAAPDPRVDGNVNIATADRQMGSAVKTITYLTAFDKGYSPALLTPDIPLDFGYQLKNWDGSYSGLILARQALVESRNIPAIYTLELVGGSNSFVDSAEKLGITTLTNRDQYGLSITLGAAEMKLAELTSVYGVYANEGIRHDIKPVIKVETSNGEDITPREWRDTEGTRVWDEREVYLLNWTICDLSNQGRLMSQYYSAGSQRLCGKTGTTDGPKDLTAFLYYPNLVVGVWTGNNNNEITTGSWGQGWSTTVPLPIASSFMSRVVGKYGNAWYDNRPAGVVSGSVCKDTGLLATSTSNCAAVSSVFLQEHIPAVDNAHVKKPICKETGLIATNESEAKALGLIDYKTFLNIKLENARHQNSLNNWLSGHKEYGSTSTLPAEGVCPIPDTPPTITITSPTGGTSYFQGDTANITISANATKGIQRVEYYIDGSSIGTVTTAPYGLSYTIPASLPVGAHTILARVYDPDGKSGDDTVVINIKSTTPTVSISMTAPTTGSTVSFPQTVTASVSGTAIVTGVTFTITGPENRSLTGVNVGGGNWTSTWAGPMTPGSYSIYATATTNVGSVQSSTITVTAP
ncbi:transglycosylase domain-containing protein [Candidatus Dojkabacteria bacterium]|nr:transglycosylase domain-containing protein [Candidatus Dojkabacteria bacterium]